MCFLAGIFCNVCSEAWQACNRSAFNPVHKNVTCTHAHIRTHGYRRVRLCISWLQLKRRNWRKSRRSDLRGLESLCLTVSEIHTDTHDHSTGIAYVNIFALSISVRTGDRQWQAPPVSTWLHRITVLVVVLIVTLFRGANTSSWFSTLHDIETIVYTIWTRSDSCTLQMDL